MPIYEVLVDFRGHGPLRVRAPNEEGAEGAAREKLFAHLARGETIDWPSEEVHSIESQDIEVQHVRRVRKLEAKKR